MKHKPPCKGCDRSSQIRFKQIRNSARRVKDRKVMGG